MLTHNRGLGCSAFHGGSSLFHDTCYYSFTHFQPLLFSLTLHESEHHAHPVPTFLVNVSSLPHSQWFQAKPSLLSASQSEGRIITIQSCSASTAAPPILPYILDRRIVERLLANDGPIFWNRMETTSLSSHGIQGLIFLSWQLLSFS